MTRVSSKPLPNSKVGKRVKKALIELFCRRDPEEAALHVSVAVAATSQKEYPKEKDNVAFTRFVEENADLVWTHHGVRLSSTLFVQGLKRNDALAADFANLSDVLYRLVRCTTVHEAGLGRGVIFTPVEVGGPVVMSGGYPATLPWQALYGLLLAVIGSEKNSDQKIPREGAREKPWTFWNVPGQPALNDFWGKREEIVRVAIPGGVVELRGQIAGTVTVPGAAK